MTIFFSTHCHALGWELGIAAASEEFRRQCEEPNDDSLPCVRTLQRLRRMADCCAWCDTGSTRLALSRSRAFHDAWQSGHALWVSCDDDCEADLSTLRSMIAAVEGEPRICIVPFWMRTAEFDAQPRLNVEFSPCHSERRLADGARLMRARSGGFGLVAVNRAALDAIAAANDHDALLYVEADAISRYALFLEAIQPNGHRWLGEDLAFFARVPTSVTVEALLTGTTVHAGHVLSLGRLAEAIDAEIASQKGEQNRATERPKNRP